MPVLPARIDRRPVPSAFDQADPALVDGGKPGAVGPPGEIEPEPSVGYVPIPDRCAGRRCEAHGSRVPLVAPSDPTPKAIVRRPETTTMLSQLVEASLLRCSATAPRGARSPPIVEMFAAPRGSSAFRPDGRLPRPLSQHLRSPVLAWPGPRTTAAAAIARKRARSGAGGEECGGGDPPPPPARAPARQSISASRSGGESTRGGRGGAGGARRRRAAQNADHG